MSIEEGKVSEDIEVIKSARAAAKGRVTRKINLLEGILLRDKNGKFVTAEINGNIAQDYKADIEAYKGAYLCSQGPMFPRSYVPKSYVPKALCSQGPMFPRPYVPRPKMDLGT